MFDKILWGIALQLDSETSTLIIGLVVLLIFVVVILALTRKFSKKALRRWFRKRGERSIDADKAYNSLLAVKTISKSFESQGIDVSPVKKLIREAEAAISLDDNKSAIEYAEKAKELLSELRAKAKKEEDVPFEEGKKAGEATDLASVLKSQESGEYTPTTKEMLQRKYPPNFLQARFTIRMAENLLASAKGEDPSLVTARSLLDESKRCFEEKDYDGALRHSLHCKRILEGKDEEQASSTKSEMEPKCPRCGHPRRPQDVFCRKCGASLTD
jgi:hypothetical protein